MGLFFYFCLGLLSASRLSAQYLESGDTWYYTRSEECLPQRFPPLLYDYLRLTVTDDTFISGQRYHRVAVVNPDLCTNLAKDFYLRDTLGTFMIWDSARASSYMLYDFNLEAGQSYSFPVNYPIDSLVHVRIDSTGETEIDGIPRKIQHVTLKAPKYFDQAGDLYSRYPVTTHYIIEGIGSTVNFFMWWEGLCHNKRAYNLRCFNAVDYTYTHDSTFLNNCDSVFFWMPDGIAEEETERIRVFPNPSSDMVYFSKLCPGYEINDTHGRIVLSSRGYSESVNITNLAPGMYLLRFIDQEMHKAPTRIIRY